MYITNCYHCDITSYTALWHNSWLIDIYWCKLDLLWCNCGQLLYSCCDLSNADAKISCNLSVYPISFCKSFCVNLALLLILKLLLFFNLWFLSVLSLLVVFLLLLLLFLSKLSECNLVFVIKITLRLKSSAYPWSSAYVC